MRIRVLAAGRSRDSTIDALVARYLARLPWQVELREIEVRGCDDAAGRRRAEGDRLLVAVPAGATVVVLDGGGEQVTSEAFAARLEALSARGRGPLLFVIGGADGLDPRLVARADWVLSLGRMIWPHLLVRVMLAEQLFRAACIIRGHPYHRGDRAGWRR